MRLFFFLFLVILLFYSTTALASCSITSTLRVGSMGAQVQCLQVNLGITADGNFGPITRAAVVAFQVSKGLVADGVFGPISNAAWFTFVDNISSFLPTGCISVIGYSPTTGAKCDGRTVNDISNPIVKDSLDKNLESFQKNINNKTSNLVNLDKFIEIVVKVNKEKGSSEEELKRMSGALREAITSSDRNFNKEFQDLLVKEGKKLSTVSGTRPFLSVVDKVAVKVFSFLGITPRTAEAIGLSFGGGVVYTFFCAANGSWMIGITPLPPSFVALLSYYPGTQGFASYNIPFTRFLLGIYEPVGACVIPSFPTPIVIPTQGTITPVVGSSPF